MRSGTAAERIHRAGSRVTPQRVLVAEALARAGRQVTAQALWEQLRDGRSRVGRATVFRTLEALVEAGVARRLEMGNHVYGYVACQPEHHHHLACTGCGQVVEIPATYVEPMARQISADLGFLVDDATLDLYGRCAACLAAKGPAPAADGRGRARRATASDGDG